jgi:hypothetical protein
MPLRIALILPAALTIAFAACGDSGENNKKAYDACVAWAKTQEKFANAEFAAQDKAQIAGMQDSSIAVVIPVKIAGQDDRVQCSIVKQQDGTFANQP